MATAAFPRSRTSNCVAARTIATRQICTTAPGRPRSEDRVGTAMESRVRQARCIVLQLGPDPVRHVGDTTGPRQRECHFEESFQPRQVDGRSP
jgi:hypothetical protein